MDLMPTPAPSLSLSLCNPLCAATHPALPLLLGILLDFVLCLPRSDSMNEPRPQEAKCNFQVFNVRNF